MSTPIISIRNITKAFPGVKAVDDVSLDIRQNEFFALLGPSGCGKTTLLRMIAGLETPTSGEILLDGQDMVRVPPNKRPINMVFQSYAVFPHMTVAENIAYGLKVTGVPKSEIGPRVEESLATAHLTHLAHRKPDQLSGGQRQRVALARALIKRPKVLLLDEPLSALDAKLRDQMRSELARLQVSVGITFIIVTHDQEEALSMADRIAVMDAGKVQQVAPPDVLYESPATRFVADFIGKVNLYEATVKGRDGDWLVVETNGLGTIALPVEKAHQGNVTIAIRPEKLHVTKHRPETARVMFEGEVTEVSYFGDSSHVMVKTPAGTLLNANIQNVSRRVGCDFDTSDKVWVTMDPEDILVLAS